MEPNVSVASVTTVPEVVPAGASTESHMAELVAPSGKGIVVASRPTAVVDAALSSNQKVLAAAVVSPVTVFSTANREASTVTAPAEYSFTKVVTRSSEVLCGV